MATDIYVGEFGKRLLINLDYNVSSATTLEIHFSSSAGTLVNSASVSVLGANTTATACGLIFSVNKAVEYILNSGDFSAAPGKYKVWIEAQFSTTSRLISSTFEFVVTTPGSTSPGT